MNHKYAHILTPLKIGNVIIKNRLMMTKAIPGNLQGPGNYPAESVIKYCAEAARNGAAIVVCDPGAFPDIRSFGTEIETEKPAVQALYNKLVDRIHAYGSLASFSTQGFMPERFVISDPRDPSIVPVDHHGPPNRKSYPEMTKEQIQEFIEIFTRHCVYMKNIGFDMVNVYMSYNAGLLARSMSPLYNQRVDEYGGSVENRARLVKELFTSIKAACGPDFLIDAQISSFEPGGYTQEDFLEFLRQWEDVIDIVQIRTGDTGLAHPSTYTLKKEEPFTLSAAEAVKKAGISVVVCPVGGYQDPDCIEQHLAQGKADMVGMARAFICDPTYGKKLIAGKGSEVRPCMRCDKCHGAVCSMNPEIGLQQVWKDMFDAVPEQKKKVAVIGGGPAGMQAAIVAADRGHQVTLYEKAGQLGGQMLHGDFVPEKWTIKDLKDYFIAQIDKREIDVKLNTAATPELIAAENYDAVLAACGSVPAKAPVPGGNEPFVWPLMNVFGQENKLGKNVVIVGGTIMAVDAALYLLHSGHRVTILTRNREIAHDHNSHGRDGTLAYLRSLEALSFVTEATTTLVEADGVTYRDKDGASHKITADSIVFHAGRTPQIDECFSFAGLSPEFRIIGDCNRQMNDWREHHFMENVAWRAEADLQQSIYTATTAAMSL